MKAVILTYSFFGTSVHEYVDRAWYDWKKYFISEKRIKIIQNDRFFVPIKSFESEYIGLCNKIKRQTIEN